MADQREEVLCGSTRGERELKSCFPQGYWHERYTDAKPVAFGHHVLGPEPLVRDGRVFGLDTGACHGGYLSALSVPDFTVYRVPAHADHWARVRRDWQLPVSKAKPWGWRTCQVCRPRHLDARSGRMRRPLIRGPGSLVDRRVGTIAHPVPTQPARCSLSSVTISSAPIGPRPRNQMSSSTRNALPSETAGSAFQPAPLMTVVSPVASGVP